MCMCLIQLVSSNELRGRVGLKNRVNSTVVTNSRDKLFYRIVSYHIVLYRNPNPNPNPKIV